MQEYLVALVIMAAGIYVLRRFLQRGRNHSVPASCGGCLGCPATMKDLSCPGSSHRPLLHTSPAGQPTLPFPSLNLSHTIQNNQPQIDSEPRES